MSDVAQGRRIILSQQPATSNQQSAASSQRNNLLTQMSFNNTELSTDSLGSQICCLGNDDAAIRTVLFGRGGRNLQIQQHSGIVFGRPSIYWRDHGGPYGENAGLALSAFRYRIAMRVDSGRPAMMQVAAIAAIMCRK